MRMVTACGSLAVVILAACTANVDTTYQEYDVRLRGPVAASVGVSVPDPFASTVQFKAILNYYEDAAGQVPYGTSLKTKPKGFSPTVTLQYSSGQVQFPLGADGASTEALPRLSASQSAIYVSSDIYGLDGTGKVFAHAHCPVQALLKVTGSVPATATCYPFFGFIGRWNEIRGPLTPRSNFAAAALPDGRVIIAGGLNSSGDPLASVEIYDPTQVDPSMPGLAAGVWKVFSPSGGDALAQARSGLSATLTASGYVFFTGGIYTSGDSPFASKIVDLFDSATNQIVPSPPALDPARANGTAALLAGDSVFVLGGSQDTTAGLPIPTTNVLAPNVATMEGPSLTTNRNSPCAVTLPTQQILVCGGASTNNTSLSTCELLDGTRAQVSGTLTTPRGDAKCARVGSTVYIEGGAASSVSFSAAGAPIEAWSNGLVTTVGNDPRFTSAPFGVTEDAAAANNGLFMAVGGYRQGTTTPLDTGFLFNPSAGNVTELTGDSAMNNPRADFQLLAMPDGTFMAIGGSHVSVSVGAEIYVPD